MIKRKIKDISLQEISLVDKPANKKPFLFFKRDGDALTGDSLSKAKKKINVEIESDGTVGGTAITINGDKVTKLKSFNFGFWEGEDAKTKVNCSYSKLVQAEGGFQRTETYYLAKGDIVMDERIKEVLKKLFGKDEDVKFEKSEFDDKMVEAIVKAVTTINEYREEFPADLGEAIGFLAVQAGQGYKQVEKKEGLEKAGAKLSKDTVAKVKALVAAAKALESILPKEAADDVQKTADNTAIAALQETVKSLADSINKETEGKTKTLEDLSKRIAAIEGKPTGTKKSLSDSDDEEDDSNVAKGAGEDGKVLWPSLVGEGRKED